jgi:hypothetical protein
MSLRKKRSEASLNFVYCNGCYIRLGIGEQQLVRHGKTYHVKCYEKWQASKGNQGTPTPDSLRRDA